MQSQRSKTDMTNEMYNFSTTSLTLESRDWLVVYVNRICKKNPTEFTRGTRILYEYTVQ